MTDQYSTLFFCVAGFAVFFVALAKAGFGGMIGYMAMPFVASFSDITTAISVLLPTYIVMDMILAWVYRKSVAYSFLWPMATAGIFGVFVAALVFRYVDIAYLAIFLGAMSFIIGMKFLLNEQVKTLKITCLLNLQVATGRA